MKIVTKTGMRLACLAGGTLLETLQRAGLAPDAPCGGHGICGKCRVRIETPSGSKEVLACQTAASDELTVFLPERPEKLTVLLDGCGVETEMAPCAPGYLLAFDIGTTTVVCYLLSGDTGAQLAAAGMLNPQTACGADVIARIQYALRGGMETLTQAIRNGMTKLIEEVCGEAGISPAEVGVISVVGNPCMQQLFLGILPDNLARVPFAPVLTKSEIRPGAEYFPVCGNASLLIVPDISGYVGADTVGCLLATGLDRAEQAVLLVDIGTNGEMLLTDGKRMTACSAAAGPALEGAKITCGMRGAAGAIDHVWMEEGRLQYSTVGGEEAIGICGSGLIDAVVVLLKEGILNRRGRIQPASENADLMRRLGERNGERFFALTERVILTQNDIREVQLAKGAIAAGIELMAGYLGLDVSEIGSVLLAGAFGSFIDPESACTVGLLPEALRGKIRAVGNAAGIGAKMLACSRAELQRTDRLLKEIEFLELASQPAFQRTFAKNMGF